MCGGGPLFENYDEAKSESGQSAAEEPAETPPTADENDPVRLMQEAIESQQAQARKDYHTLHGYIEGYRARADNLETQVGKWCDELEETAAGHKKTVATYMKKYHHLGGVQNGIMARVHSLEVLLANQQTSKGCSKTCHCQNDSIPKWTSKMEARMQVLEYQCKKKDDKIQSLSARCDTLQKRAARHERETQDKLSSALPTKSKSDAAGPASTVEVDARLTNLAETIAVHGHYFEEIRDRVLHQESATKEARELVDNLPQSQGLEGRIEEAVTRIHKENIDQRRQEIQQYLDKLAKSVEDYLAQQALANQERFKLLEKADQNLDSKLSKSKKETGSVLAYVKTSIDGQIAAHKEAADVGIKKLDAELAKSKEHTDSVLAGWKSSLDSQIAAYREVADVETKGLIASFNEKLIDFARELQGDHLIGMKAQIQRQADQLQHLQSQHDALKARLDQHSTAQPDIPVVDPVAPATPLFQFQFGSFPPFESTFGAGHQSEAAEQNKPAGNIFGPVRSVSGDQTMADANPYPNYMSENQDETSSRGHDTTGNAAEEQEDGLYEPEAATGAPLSPIEEDFDASTDAEGESMDIESGGSSEVFAVRTAAPDRDSKAATVVGPPGNLATGGGPPAKENEIPGLGMLPLSESSRSHYGLEPTRMSGVGDNPTTDSALYNRATGPSDISGTLNQSSNLIQSPFSGIVSSAPRSEPSGGAFTQARFAAPERPAREAQPVDVVDSNASHLTTTPMAGPIHQRSSPPPPQPQPTDPPSPNTVADKILRNSFHFQPTPASPRPNFSYSVEYIGKLRTHLVVRVLESWIREKFSKETAGEILELVLSRNRRFGSIRDDLAPRANLAPQDGYFDTAVERIFSAWFDVCIVDEVVEDFEESLLAAGFEKKVERDRFVEEHVRPYMKAHPADC